MNPTVIVFCCLLNGCDKLANIPYLKDNSIIILSNHNKKYFFETITMESE